MGHQAATLQGMTHYMQNLTENRSNGGQLSFFIGLKNCSIKLYQHFSLEAHCRRDSLHALLRLISQLPHSSYNI